MLELTQPHSSTTKHNFYMFNVRLAIFREFRLFTKREKKALEYPL
jgi:hypothetical protein